MIGSHKEKISNDYRGIYLVILLIVLFVFTILRHGWLSDDAYITFRVVDNFIHGYGLRWNIVERVQPYTHPLWMFLVSLFYLFTREIYWTVIILSIACSVVAVVLLVYRLSLSYIASGVILLILLLSKAFVTYSTSGLENPLSHLLIVVFYIILFTQKPSIKWLGRLSLVASLGIVNRMDLVLLFLPGLIYGFWKFRNWEAVRAILVGMTPFWLWELFSIWYYGFPFPNSAYAKLNTGIAQSESFKQGFVYLLYTLQFDPITFFGMALGIFLAAVNPDRRLWLPVSGGLIYLFYIFWIGGDFMGGRMFTVCLMSAMIAVARSDLGDQPNFNIIGIYAMVLLIGLFYPRYSSIVVEKDEVVETKVGTLDVSYSPSHYGMKLLNFTPIAFPDSSIISDGRFLRDSQTQVAIRHPIGMSGYYAGPNVHIIDALALADPLLARLPAKRNLNWRPGHFERAIPEKYANSIKKGTNLLTDKNLALYYDQLKIITQGNLFSPKRLLTILRMNLGYYNVYIDQDAYLYADAVNLQYQEPEVEKPPVLSCENPDVIHFNDSGIFLELDQPLHRQVMEISLTQDMQFIIQYYLEGEMIGSQEIPTMWLGRRNATSERSLEIPESVTEKGFDHARIIPVSGYEKPPYCLAYIQFK